MKRKEPLVIPEIFQLETELKREKSDGVLEELFEIRRLS